MLETSLYSDENSSGPVKQDYLIGCSVSSPPLSSLERPLSAAAVLRPSNADNLIIPEQCPQKCLSVDLALSPLLRSQQAVLDTKKDEPERGSITDQVAVSVLLLDASVCDRSAICSEFVAASTGTTKRAMEGTDEGGGEPGSPQPPPRGAYKINWDEIDEFSDPFNVGGSKASSAPKPAVSAATPKESPAKSSPRVGGSKLKQCPALKKSGASAATKRLVEVLTIDTAAAPSALSGSGGDPAEQPELVGDGKSSATDASIDSVHHTQSVLPTNTGALSFDDVVDTNCPLPVCGSLQDASEKIEKEWYFDAGLGPPADGLLVPSAANLCANVSTDTTTRPLALTVSGVDLNSSFDPFSSRHHQLSSSPPPSAMAVVADLSKDLDPFASRHQLSSSPSLSQTAHTVDVDAFASRLQLASSPAQCPAPDDFNLNPFASRRQLASSPPPCSANLPISLLEAEGNPPVSNEASQNPFATKAKISASPPTQRRSLDQGYDSGLGDPAVLSADVPAFESQEPAVELELATAAAAPSMGPPRTAKVIKKKVGVSKFSKFRESAKKLENNNCDVFSEPPVEAVSGTLAADPISLNGAVDNSQGKLGSVASTDVYTTVVEQEIVDLVDNASAAHTGEQEETDEEFVLANETFKPASEVFKEDAASWDMLAACGHDGKADSLRLARESLYVKFDPLLGSRSPAYAAATNRSNLPGTAAGTLSSSDDLLLLDTPPAASKAAASLLAGSAKKLKHPAVRLLQQQAQSASGSEGASGAVAADRATEVDKLLLLGSPAAAASGGTYEGAHAANLGSNLLSQEVTASNIVQMLKYSQEDMDRARRDLELDFQSRMLNKEREWDRRLHEQSSQLATRTDELERLQDKYTSLKSVVTEYEHSMAELIEKRERGSSDGDEALRELTRERNQLLEDLRGVEGSFSELHRRYEKVKKKLDEFKLNEEALRRALADYKTSLENAEQRHDALRDTAEERLREANEKIDKVRQTASSDLARLQAAQKRADLQIQSLEKQLQQKTQECVELTVICDELISKVGTG